MAELLGEMEEETLSQDWETGCGGPSCCRSGHGSGVMHHKVRMGKAWRRACWVGRERERWRAVKVCTYPHIEEVCLRVGGRHLLFARSGLSDGETERWRSILQSL
jgi:hypothetical protein